MAKCAGVPSVVEMDHVWFSKCATLTATSTNIPTPDENAKDPAVEGYSNDILSSDSIQVSSALSGKAFCSVTLATLVEMPEPHEEGPGSELRATMAAKLGVDRTRVLLYANLLEISDFGFIDLRSASCQPVQYVLMDEHDDDSDLSEGVLVHPNSQLSAWARQEWLHRQQKEQASYERISLLLPRCNRPRCNRP